MQRPLHSVEDLQDMCRTWSATETAGSGERGDRLKEDDGGGAAVSGSSGVCAPSLPEAGHMVGSGDLEALVASDLCQMDVGATIVIGPGCKIHGNKWVRGTLPTCRVR